MFALSSSELLFYGGIAAMALAALLALICTFVFQHTGKKLKEKFEQEYGKLPK